MPKKHQETNKNGQGRTRVWSFIAYPDSAPTDWEQILTERFNLRWARSPLHDKDLNADETQKKPHWHVALVFDGVKRYEQVKEISDTINATIPQKVHNLQGLMRYFLHLDNPEKAQYDFKDIKAVGINSELEILGQTDFNKKLKSEIFEFIRGNDLFEYSELLDFLQYDYEQHFEYATTHTILFVAYLRSRRHKAESTAKR